jgi:hypothetical protein
MGQALACEATFKRQRSSGRAELETDYVLFRGDFRVKLPFAGITGVSTRDGVLTLKSADGTLTLGSAIAPRSGRRRSRHRRADSPRSASSQASASRSTG